MKRHLLIGTALTLIGALGAVCFPAGAQSPPPDAPKPPPEMPYPPVLPNASFETVETNPTFETVKGAAPQGWIPWQKAAFAVDTAVTHAGLHSLRIEKPVGASGWRTDYYGLPSSADAGYPLYTFKAWAKRTDAQGEVFVAIFWYDDHGFVASSWGKPLVSVGSWEEISVSALPPPAATRFRLSLRADSPSGTAWFDDASMTATLHTSESLADVLAGDTLSDVQRGFACGLLARDGKASPLQVALLPQDSQMVAFNHVKRLMDPDALIALGTAIIQGAGEDTSWLKDVPLSVATAWASKGDYAFAQAAAIQAARMMVEPAGKAAALILAGDCARESGLLDQAATLYGQVAGLATNDQHKALAILRKAEALEGTKDANLARISLEKILTDFDAATDPALFQKVKTKLGLDRLPVKPVKK